jgi:hypothetical protein
MHSLKHALQMYITRDNCKKEDDIKKESELLDIISGNIETFQKWANVKKEAK